jgi:hypothetical protein
VSSIQTQFLNLKAHHSQYPVIDPRTVIEREGIGQSHFITGASQGIDLGHLDL